MSFFSCFSPKPKEELAEPRKTDVEELNRKQDPPPLSNAGPANGAPVYEEAPVYKPEPELSGFDTARELPQPPATAMAQITKPKPKAGVSKKASAGQRFVKELPRHPEFRRQLVELIKAGTDDEGLAGHLVAYINDNGYSLSSLAALTEAMHEARTSSLLMWASRYNLFVMWSADRMHPWDSLAPAEGACAILEIGKAEFGEEAIVLLDGMEIKDWTFKNGIFATRDPVYWTTPLGDQVLVELSLRFGTFFGYTKPSVSDDDFNDAGSQSYLGTQCHGVMWPAESDLPHGWPVAPPIVAGKVNIASRTAALSPGATDPISTFAGVYTTHYLPTAEGKNVRSGPELSISANNNGSSVVSLNGAKVEAWAFSPNNVLSWEDGAGHTAWLLFMSLAGGPVIMGNVLKPDQAPPSGFSIFGELKNQPSRLSPSDQMDAVVGHKVAAGLQVASTLLLGEILDLTQKLWVGSSKHANGQANGHASSPDPELLLHHKIDTLLQLEDLSDLFSRAFLDSAPEGGVEVSSIIEPGLTEEVESFCKEAEAKMEAANYTATAAEKDARETEEADKSKNVAVATYKAAQASLRAQEAAESAAAAEQLAVEAATSAARASTAKALDYALAAAQAFNQARKEACIAARAERRAAAAALSSVEAGIELHARAKNFDKLRETAQASGIATKVLSLASQAVEGWETNTAASRLAALQAAKAAAVDAQDCNKHTRRMQPVGAPDYEQPPAPTGRVPGSPLM